MIDKIKNYLLVVLVGAVGALLTLLRLKSRKLHQVKVRLLMKDMEAKIAENNERIKAAKERFNAALKDYNDKKNGK